MSNFPETVEVPVSLVIRTALDALERRDEETMRRCLQILLDATEGGE